MSNPARNPANPDPAPQSGEALFGVLSSHRDPQQAYTAVEEIRSMAGHNVVTQLTALIQANAARQDAAMADLSGRLDAVEKQLGRMWALLLVLFAAVLGALTTFLTLAFPAR